MDRGIWQATVHGVIRVGHDLANKPPPQKRNAHTVGVQTDETLHTYPLDQDTTLERWWGERQKSESLVCLCEVVLAQGPGDRQGTELVRGSLSFPLWSALKLQQFGVA